jgi:hypothetical protein
MCSPREIGRWSAGVSVARAQPVRLEPSYPRLSRNGMSHLGQIRYFSTVWSVADCFQQPQDLDIDAVAFADCDDYRLHLLPPRNSDGDRCQPADQGTLWRNEHEPSDARLRLHYFLAVHAVTVTTLQRCSKLSYRPTRHSAKRIALLHNVSNGSGRGHLN